VPGFISTGWAGIMAPKGLPKPIYDKIYASLVKVMKDAQTREMFERQGAEPLISTPEEMLKLINAEYGRFSQAIKLANLTIQ
jgi:tripartite-type tricarboxylate transporter receptor subunit TctC